MIHQLPLPDRLHSFRRITSQTSPTAVPSSACRRMKAICASVNFDLFMVLPRSAARIADAAKLEFSSKDRSNNREAGHGRCASVAGGAGRRSAAGHAANAGTNTSGAGGLYPIEAWGLIVL